MKDEQGKEEREGVRWEGGTWGLEMELTDMGKKERGRRRGREGE